MDLPPRVKRGNSCTKEVCKLKKSLYGLKQFLIAWFWMFSSAMKVFGYKQSNSDHTLFIKHQKGKVTILIVYVYDMLVIGVILVK
jgi:hypothetical protein